MRQKYLIFFCLFPLAFADAPAEAGTLFLKCQRYESKCKAAACYQLGEALRADKDGTIYKVKITEPVQYAITADSATASLENPKLGKAKSGGQYTITYKRIPREDEPNLIVLEIRTSVGEVKERVEIDRLSGIYAHYLIHSDNSIKDVPLGEPYTAYFGWCAAVKDLPK